MWSFISILNPANRWIGSSRKKRTSIFGSTQRTDWHASRSPCPLLPKQSSTCHYQPSRQPSGCLRRSRGYARGAILAPMLTQGEIVGVIAVWYHRRRPDLSADFQAAFQHLANQIAASFMLQDRQAMKEQFSKRENGCCRPVDFRSSQRSSRSARQNSAGLARLTRSFREHRFKANSARFQPKQGDAVSWWITL